ncbi:hypothetical protein GOP47_0024803 [Adiantum capillus-veneris]|uniref:Calcineurin-like phosphoesterase domain-containing protein n=1 Tax=Adiantum capillus-veneris TaxID=13818 RepID=A0A9D4Z2Z1_ADICA|nr:hypothetical protein GOP47_0024803 [Adiantum capillus-veneris]
MPRKPVFLLSYLSLSFLVFVPWILLHFLSDPSCSPFSPVISASSTGKARSDHVQLKAMVVGDLHLGGATTLWLDRARRDAFMKASLKRAFQTLKPHSLLVLGDVSDWGRKSTKEQWHSVILRFKDMTMPFSGLPFHVLPGNHDVGDYYQITTSLMQQFVDAFPGLDDTGNEVFMIRNITFISLNAMALACEECPLYNTLKKVVEHLEVVLQTAVQSAEHTQQADLPIHSPEYASTRPILLTHLPLYREDEGVCDSADIPICAPWHEVEGGCKSLFQSPTLYHKKINYRSRIDMLSLNTSRLLLSVFKPRLVLSAHAHRFCSRAVEDGVKEITVSTFTWRNRDDPSFLLLQFYKDGTCDVQQCFLPRESFVLGMHILQGSILITVVIFGGLRYRRMQKGARLHLKT